MSTERNMASVSPIPKIVTTPIRDDYSRDEKEDHADEWGKTSVDQSDDRQVARFPQNNKILISSLQTPNVDIFTL